MTELLHAWSGLLRDHPAALTYVLAWCAGGLVWIVGTCWLAHRDGLPLGRTAIVLVALIPTVFVGARAHALLGEAGVAPAELWRRPAMLLEPGWRLPGGLLLAMLVGPLLASALRLPVLRLADAALPFVGAVFSVGRLGCFTQGCCHGRVSSVPWAVRFGPTSEAYANHLARGLLPSGAAESLPVHPLQLYMAVSGLVVTLVLLRWWQHRRFVGEIALTGIVLLSAMNVGLELLRESEGTTPVRLRSALPAVIGTVAAVVLAVVRWRRAGPPPPTGATVRC